MSRRAVYVQRGGPLSEPPRRRANPLPLLVLIVLLLAAAAVLYWQVLERRREAASVLPDFHAAFEAADYPAVLESYHRAREAALVARGDENRAVWEHAVAEMETSVHERMDEIMAAVLASGTGQLAKDDVRFFTEMGELSTAYLDRRGQQTAEAVMLAETSVSDAGRLFTALRTIPSMTEAAALYLENLGQMELCGEAYREARELDANQDYYRAVDRLESLLKEADVQDTGPAHDIVQGQIAALKEKMRPYYLEEIRRLMARGRYVTAGRRIEILEKYFEGDNELASLYEETKGYMPANLERYTGRVRQLVIRPLIVNRGIAFSGNQVSAAADQTMMTVSEFRGMLELLYERGYMLIDQATLLDESGTAAPLYLPKGRRALVLSIDQLNYYPARRLSGNCTNLVLDEEGEVAGVYRDEMGEEIVSREAEAIGILEMFIEEHPDFSYDGAKGTISLSGRYGIFGYPMNDAQLAARNAQSLRFGVAAEILEEEQLVKNRRDCQAVINRLLENGWTFASFSYAGVEMGELTMEDLKEDCALWKEEVGSMIGPTNIFVYPNGINFRGTDERKSYLLEQGFQIFGGLGPTIYVHYERGYYFMDRLAVGGYSMRQGLTQPVFDARPIYDSSRPSPLPAPTPTPPPTPTPTPLDYSDRR
ncbi:MAG: hypothetical protein QM296_13875 [Bacillota bacterium]|nr:hypothetical protein [Bacillota bacterium]